MRIMIKGFELGCGVAMALFGYSLTTGIIKVTVKHAKKWLHDRIEERMEEEEDD